MTVTDGECFTTPAVEITEALRASLVALGGFTHPLFTQPETVSLPAGSPLPGQAVLLLMGGLVERSNRLDDAVALLGFREVSFTRPAVPGCQLRVDVCVVGHTATRGGRRVREMRWQAVDDDGAVLVEAVVLMLVGPEAG